MKNIKFISSLILAITCITICSNAQEKGFIFADRNSLDFFNRVADNKSEKVVFKLLQFNAPFSGVYRHTQIDSEGKVYTVRVTPFAHQNSRRAELTATQIVKIKQSLLDLTSNNCTKISPTQKDELYSALIFNNGKSFLRCDFIGDIPGELQTITDFLDEEFNKADEELTREINAKEKLVREKYGDWEKNPNLIRPSATGVRSLQNKKIILLNLRGKQQPVTENSKEFPLYYALISYPKGRVIGGAGGGTWSFEPFARNGASWAISDNSNEAERNLVIEYSVIDKTISVENKTFKLKNGNLFIFKYDENWNLKIKQLNKFILESVNDSMVLPIFEKRLNEKLAFPEKP